MYIPLSWDLEYVPLDGLVELGEVDPDVHDGTVLLLVSMPQVHLQFQCLFVSYNALINSKGFL